MNKKTLFKKINTEDVELFRIVVNAIYNKLRSTHWHNHDRATGKRHEDFFHIDQFGKNIEEYDVQRIAQILDEELKLVSFKERSSNFGTAFVIDFKDESSWKKFVEFKGKLNKLLKNKNSNSSNSTNKKRLSFDAETYILSIDKKQISFKRSKKNALILNILLNEMKPTPDEFVLFGDIADIKDPDEVLSDKYFRNGIEQIGYKIKQETGIDDFFIESFSDKCKINSKYLQKPT